MEALGPDTTSGASASHGIAVFTSVCRWLVAPDAEVIPDRTSVRMESNGLASYDMRIHVSPGTTSRFGPISSLQVASADSEWGNHVSGLAHRLVGHVLSGGCRAARIGVTPPQSAGSQPPKSFSNQSLKLLAFQSPVHRFIPNGLSKEDAASFLR